MTVELRRRPRYGEAVHEFRAGELNRGLASMAVVVGTGVYQLISIYILLLRRNNNDNRT